MTLGLYIYLKLFDFQILELSRNKLSQTDLLGASALLYLSLYFLQMLLRLGIYERYMNAGLIGYVFNLNYHGYICIT